jgi:hypothetical protein
MWPVNIAVRNNKSSFLAQKSGPVDEPVFFARIILKQKPFFPGMRTAEMLFTSRQSPWAYLTVMVTVAELGNVSVPPGPKLTVPMTLNTALDVPAAGVTF